MKVDGRWEQFVELSNELGWDDARLISAINRAFQPLILTKWNKRLSELAKTAESHMRSGEHKPTGQSVSKTIYRIRDGDITGSKSGYTSAPQSVHRALLRVFGISLRDLIEHWYIGRDLPLGHLIVEAPQDRSQLSRLSAAAQETSFVGRKDELQSLLDWVHGARTMSVQVRLGAGGSGKTRLALELIKVLGTKQAPPRRKSGRVPAREKPWTVGFLNHREFKEQFLTEKNVDKWVPSQNTLVVVDYAAGVADELGKWMQTLLPKCQPSGGKLRILLLERFADKDIGWWASAFTCPKVCDAYGRTSPPAPMAGLGRRNLQRIFERVYKNFAGDLPPDFWGPEFDDVFTAENWGDQPLGAMMAAAVAAETGDLYAIKDMAQSDLAKSVAQYEITRIKKLASCNDDGRQLCHLVAAITLSGGISGDDLRLFSEQEGINAEIRRLIFNVLPVIKTPGEPEHILPMTPDVPAEAMMFSCLGYGIPSEAQLSVNRMMQITFETTIKVLLRAAAGWFYYKEHTASSWLLGFIRSLPAGDSQIDRCLDVVPSDLRYSAILSRLALKSKSLPWMKLKERTDDTPVVEFEDMNATRWLMPMLMLERLFDKVFAVFEDFHRSILPQGRKIYELEPYERLLLNINLLQICRLQLFALDMRCHDDFFYFLGWSKKPSIIENLDNVLPRILIDLWLMPYSVVRQTALNQGFGLLGYWLLSTKDEVRIVALEAVLDANRRAVDTYGQYEEMLPSLEHRLAVKELAYLELLLASLKKDVTIMNEAATRFAMLAHAVAREKNEELDLWPLDTLLFDPNTPRSNIHWLMATKPVAQLQFWRSVETYIASKHSEDRDVSGVSWSEAAKKDQRTIHVLLDELGRAASDDDEYGDGYRSSYDLDLMLQVIVELVEDEFAGNPGEDRRAEWLAAYLLHYSDMPHVSWKALGLED